MSNTRKIRRRGTPAETMRLRLAEAALRRREARHPQRVAKREAARRAQVSA